MRKGFISTYVVVLLFVILTFVVYTIKKNDEFEFFNKIAGIGLLIAEELILISVCITTTAEGTNFKNAFDASFIGSILLIFVLWALKPSHLIAGIYGMITVFLFFGIRQLIFHLKWLESENRI